MSSTINTSRAQQVIVNLFDYDSINLSLTYTDANGAPLDLTQYKFRFVLNTLNNGFLFEYVINAGDLSTTYLSKTGASHNVLNMQLMFEDLRDRVNVSQAKLIQVVTDTQNLTFVHIVYTINASRY